MIPDRVAHAAGENLRVARAASSAPAEPAAVRGADMPDDGFPIELVAGVPVLAAPDEIDITNAGALGSALLNAAGNGHRTLVVDMSRTQFCDVSGLRAVLATGQRAEAEGREVLVIPSAAVARVLALTGMDRLIPCFTSIADALLQRSGLNGETGRGSDK